jgi:transcriptional regulator with XRE-family HTH domain
MRIYSEKNEKTSFGDWLREARVTRGLGVRELAAIVKDECSASYISYLERNVYSGKNGNPTRPSEPVVAALAKGLNMPLNEARLAAGYNPIEDLEPESEFAYAFASLFEGYNLLSENGKTVAEKQVDSLIRGLMSLEGVNFSDHENSELRSSDVTDDSNVYGLDTDAFTIDLSNPEPILRTEEEVLEFHFMSDAELRLRGFKDSEKKATMALPRSQSKQEN